MTVVAQPKYATLDGKVLAKVFRAGGKDQLLAITPPAGRRLHAKAIAFETPGGTYWATGSANATMAAFFESNTESVLWFSTKESVREILKGDAFTIEEIKPSAFEAGLRDTRTKNDELAAFDLRLVTAVLKNSGSLEVAFEAPSYIRDMTLRIRNIN